MTRDKWRAIIIYRTDAGATDVEHLLEEIGDLHDPHWDTVVSINITRINHCDAADLTVERAMEI